MKKLICLLLVAVLVCVNCVSCGYYITDIVDSIKPDDGETPDTDDVIGDIGDDNVEETPGDEVVSLLNDILILEGKTGEGDILADILAQRYNVTKYSFKEDADKMPTDLVHLADYEQIVLVNVAYSDMPEGFDYTLHKYVNDLGGGLFTVGGSMDEGDTPHAYNRTDISLSQYLKKMLPVEALNYEPSVALMIIVDTSASFVTSGALSLIKPNLAACFDVLNERDYCGVISFKTASTEVIEILPVSEKDRIRDAINSSIIDDPSTASGGTVFSSAIYAASEAFKTVENVDKKHILLFTDGNPGDSFETYLPYIEQNMYDGITMSVVTIGNTDKELEQKMQDTAEAGGGIYYAIKTYEADTIPQLIVNDILAVAKIGTYFNEAFIPSVNEITSAVEGVDEDDMPLLNGFFSNVAKREATVVLMGKHDPIYAEWKYGNGSVGSFMCDLSGIWSDEFVSDDVGKQIIFGIIESLMATEPLM